jgi:hypothetical protein
MYSEVDKQLYVELLIALYITSAANGPTPKSLIPTMLIWKGEHTLLNWDNEESEENSKKVFVMATQPGFFTREADWVSTWEALVDDQELMDDVEEEAKTVLPDPVLHVTPQITPVPDQNPTEEEHVLSTDEKIFNQRLALYNFIVLEFCNILIEIHHKNFTLAQVLFKASNVASSEM